jgi:hypothetical protein
MRGQGEPERLGGLEVGMADPVIVEPQDEDPAICLECIHLWGVRHCRNIAEIKGSGESLDVGGFQLDVGCWHSIDFDAAIRLTT